MAIEVHREPLYRRYYAPYLSSTFLYISLFGFVLIFLPLIIAYNSANFWLKDKTQFEQPSIKYRYHSIFEIFGSSTSGDDVNIFYSTSTTINNLYESTLRIPILRSAELDDNLDGITDRFEISMAMPISSNERIFGFSAIFYHDVKLSTPVKYTFDAVSYAHYQSAVPLAKVDMDGDVNIRQTWLFTSKGGYKVPYQGDKLIDIDATRNSASDFSISNLMERNNARNFSIVYEPRYTHFSRFIPRVIPDSEQSYFNVSIVMRIQEQPIRYSPLPSELLKNAWIQYMAYFIVVAFILFRLNSFIFRHKLVPAYAVADVVFEKME